MKLISDDMIAEAEQATEIARALLASADIIVALHGSTDPSEAVNSLVEAAWLRNAELSPGDPAEFVRFLRRFADIVETSGRPH